MNRTSTIAGGALLLGIVIGGSAPNAYQRLVYGQPITIHAQMVSVHTALRRHADVVLLGDSLTQWGAWDELLPEVNLANRGIAGDKVVDIERRVETVYQLTPRVIVLTAGTNDLLAGRPVTEVFDGYRALADDIRRHGIRLIAVAVPRAGSQHPEAGHFNARVEEFNLRLHSYCQQHAIACPIIDTPGDVDHLRMPDGVHLNGAAYLEWAQALAEWLRDHNASK